jgi:WS/DGAT/MGAT family acyltransferase
MSTGDAAAFFRTWGSAEEMNDLEAAMWRGERHPANSSSGVFIEILDAAPDWGRLVGGHEKIVRLLPRFGQRVVDPPLSTGPPRWVDDDQFDLGYHLRRVRLAGDGSRRDLLDFAQARGVTPFDRTRPPWVGHLVEGLEGGGAAYVLVVHHCLMDGGAAQQLLSFVQNRDPDVRLPWSSGGARTPAPERPLPGVVSGALATAGLLRRTASVATSAARMSPRTAAAYAASMARVLAPPPATPSPLMNRGRRVAWRFGTAECDLADLKAAAKAAGGTLNDAYVAGMLGGIRRYHQRAQAPLGDIPVSMPVSMRVDGDQSGGNRFAAAFFAGPTSVEDPVERIRLLRETVGGLQKEPALDFFSALLPLANRMPQALTAGAFIAMQARADLTASNVPGVPWTIHMAGRKVERMLCFGALPGSALMTVLCSYDGHCSVGINCDGGSFDDPEQLFADLQAGLDEVLALAP